MKLMRVVAIIGLTLAAGGTVHAARPSRAECRRACERLIGFCELHRHPAACRRAIIRQCRRNGTASCDIDSVPVTTTTVTPMSFPTTTTIDPGPTVNGCNRLEAEDHRGESQVVVRFGPFDYAPECILVSAGTTVRFSGTSFTTFPLYGGVVAQPDSTSPFMPPTTHGFTKDFVMSTPGIYPYFTEILWSVLAQMYGAVIVD